MAVTQGQNANASDFINESEKNATPTNDNGRVPKLETVESEGAKISRAFLPSSNRKIGINTTEVSIVNGASAAETTLFTVTIPADTLGTNNAIRFRVYFSFVRMAGSTVTFRVKFGGTTYNTIATPAVTQNNGYQGYLDGYIIADGSTSAQKMNASLELLDDDVIYEENGDAAVGISKITVHTPLAAPTQDSTLAKDLVITAQYSATDVADDLTAEYIIVEKIS